MKLNKVNRTLKNPNIDPVFKPTEDNQHLPAFLVGSGILRVDFPFTECLCF